MEALRKSFALSKKTNRLYQKRRDTLVAGLKNLGFPVKPNPATFYLFTRLPHGGKDSTLFCKKLLAVF